MHQAHPGARNPCAHPFPAAAGFTSKAALLYRYFPALAILSVLLLIASASLHAQQKDAPPPTPRPQQNIPAPDSAFTEKTQQLDQVIVTTGTARAVSIRQNPIAILSVSAARIDRTLAGNVIDVLVKNAPGLSAVKTGPNISKPFIRGLGYNRVLTLYDGIRQEGQQWGDEHGIEIDGYNIIRAEVIKGPASLLYGSDALAGVVSLFPYVPTDQDGRVHGRWVGEYQDNNGMIGNGLRIGARTAHWYWTLNGALRLAKNYRNPVDGRVYLTGFSERNASAMFGYHNDNGYTRFNLTLYDNLQGIPDGSRDSLSRRFTKQILETGLDDIRNRPLVTQKELDSYTLSPLHQHIQHYRAYVNNHYRLGGGIAEATIGFQQNIRREYNHPTDIYQAGLYVRLNTLNYGLRYDLPAIGNLDLSFGLNGMHQANLNKEATDFPIPDYHLNDLGSFAYGRWKHGPWTISGGLRTDRRQLRGKDFYVAPDPRSGFDQQVHSPDTSGASLQFPALHQDFSGWSWSLGATWQASEYISLKANIARGYRSPNITEIASNGLDPGAHIVYLGNRSFVPEFSLQEDIGLLAAFPDIDFAISLFSNHIDHYIYLTQLTDAQGQPITLVPGNKTFQYTQASAWLYGFEGSMDLHPASLPGFRLSLQALAAYGINTRKSYAGKGANGRYLPLIPPPRLVTGLDQDLHPPAAFRHWLNGVSIHLGMENVTRQNRYLGLDGTETPTPGYTLVDLGLRLKFPLGKRSDHDLELVTSVSNLFNTAYQSNLNRLKYFEYYSQSPNGRSGIYDMGRNICMKLILPF